jgi:Xaa-Pro aminopeptidase
MTVPEIPKSEYPERVERVRRLMHRHEVDAALVYHDELHMSNGCYLTNYWPTIEAGACCTFSVNRPATAEQRRFLGHLAEALCRTRDALRPGLRGREIDAVPRGFLAGLGYGPYLTMGIVHTVGLNEYERPFFGPNSDEVLEPNMTVCIDVSMFGHPVFYGSRVEAGYVIREFGAEPLSTALEELILSQARSSS